MPQVCKIKHLSSLQTLMGHFREFTGVAHKTHKSLHRSAGSIQRSSNISTNTELLFSPQSVCSYVGKALLKFTLFLLKLKVVETKMNLDKIATFLIYSFIVQLNKFSPGTDWQTCWQRSLSLAQHQLGRAPDSLNWIRENEWKSI